MRILVTGGLGFIGSALIRLLIEETDHEVVNLDKVSYASTTESVASASGSPRYQFEKCDLVNVQATADVVNRVKPNAIIHLAAESHVDRSIDGPRVFLDSNVIGTFNLLQAARDLNSFERFVHVSTDEVFGSLSADDEKFNEESPYDPRSPYSATKASSDHIVRAWGETYGLPYSLTNCSNNFGPYQFPEKLMPLTIIKALHGENLPVYGLGLNIRDWLHVEDHARALLLVTENGKPNETYTIGADNEKTNIEVVQAICDHVNRVKNDGLDRKALIEFVQDRPGHDLRYAIDASKITSQLGWSPQHTFEGGLQATVEWYVEHEKWWKGLQAGASDRIGLNTPTKVG